MIMFKQEKGGQSTDKKCMSLSLYQENSSFPTSLTNELSDSCHMAWLLLGSLRSQVIQGRGVCHPEQKQGYVSKKEEAN